MAEALEFVKACWAGVGHEIFTDGDLEAKISILQAGDPARRIEAIFEVVVSVI
jgi:hypothetical protein